MLRFFKFAAAVALVGLLATVIYLVAAMQVKAPLSMRIVDVERQETNGVHAEVKFTYELKNASFISVQVLEAHHLGASPSTIEYTFKSAATPFLLSPGAVHRETRTISVNDDDEYLKNAFSFRWDPATKPLIQPLLDVIKKAGEWWHGTNPLYPAPLGFQPKTQEFPAVRTEITQKPDRQ